MNELKYEISVGEPWDFEGPDGPNIIKGKIIDIVSRHCAIFKADKLIEFEGYKNMIIVLFARYDNEDLTMLEKGERKVINGGLLLTNYDTNAHNEEELMQHSKFFIIGSIKKVFP
jgi:hypothetical protein